VVLPVAVTALAAGGTSLSRVPLSLRVALFERFGRTKVLLATFGPFGDIITEVARAGQGLLDFLFQSAIAGEAKEAPAQ
jgi:hypothetical protein